MGGNRFAHGNTTAAGEVIGCADATRGQALAIAVRMTEDRGCAERRTGTKSG